MELPPISKDAFHFTNSKLPLLHPEFHLPSLGAVPPNPIILGLRSSKNAISFEDVKPLDPLKDPLMDSMRTAEPLPDGISESRALRCESWDSLLHPRTSFKLGFLSEQDSRTVTTAIQMFVL
jgi:hypothetical protein